MLSIDFLYVIYNNYNYIEKSIKDLKEISKNYNCQINIYIVDNSYKISHKDEVIKIVCFCKDNLDEKFFIQYLPSDKNLGFSRACNKASSLGNSRKLIILNCDTRLNQTDFKSLLESISLCNTKNPIVGIKILNENQESSSSFFSYDPISILLKPLIHLSYLSKISHFILSNNIIKSRLNRISYKGFYSEDISLVDWVSGCFMIIDREFFDSIGGFDERFFMYFEDTDICRKARKENKGVLFDPRTSIVHYGQYQSRSSRGLFSSILFNKTSRYHIFSWIKYILKWKEDYLTKLELRLKSIFFKSNSTNFINGYSMDFSNFSKFNNEKDN